MKDIISVIDNRIELVKAKGFTPLLTAVPKDGSLVEVLTHDLEVRRLICSISEKNCVEFFDESSDDEAFNTVIFGWREIKNVSEDDFVVSTDGIYDQENGTFNLKLVLAYPPTIEYKPFSSELDLDELRKLLLYPFNEWLDNTFFEMDEELVKETQERTKEILREELSRMKLAKPIVNKTRDHSNIAVTTIDVNLINSPDSIRKLDSWLVEQIFTCVSFDVLKVNRNFIV